MKDQYAVFGNPIAHSKSPDIHKLFAKQTGQDINYTTQLVELGHFSEAAKKFFDNGGKGLNVTVPFKHDAYKFVNELYPKQLSETALLAKAVNTLKKNPDGSISGDNTDGIGLIRDLRNKCRTGLPSEYSLIGRSVLIIGAGGAVSGVLPSVIGKDETTRGILSEIVREGFSEIVIANRTKTTAIELAEKFNKLQSQIKIIGCNFDDIPKQPFDLIINGTSASLSGDLPPLPSGLISANTVCYDMMYGKEDTVFMTWAKESGSKRVYDGLGMLVEQAAESFRIWRKDRHHKIEPDTATVYAQLQKEL